MRSVLALASPAHVRAYGMAMCESSRAGRIATGIGTGRLSDLPPPIRPAAVAARALAEAGG
jgi:hypothetical protein